MRRMRTARGFTLIELIIALAVGSLLIGMTVWQITETLPGWRAAGGARWVLQKSRDAAALAARTNRPVELRIDADGPAECNPSITVQSVPIAGGTPTVYDRLCLNKEFPGVALGNGGTTQAVRCEREEQAGLVALPNCSTCAGSPNPADLTNIVRIMPSGETATAAGAGSTIIFTSARAPGPQNTVAVGIRNVTGRTTAYRPIPTGTRWECK